jgi:pilus assembly protein CpaE
VSGTDVEVRDVPAPAAPAAPAAEGQGGVKVLYLGEDRDIARDIAATLAAMGNASLLPCPQADPGSTSVLRRSPDVLVADLDVVGCVPWCGEGTFIIAVSRDESAGTILAAMRAGAREFLPKPVSRERWAAVLSRASAETAAGGKHGTVYAFLGAKGGVGTTTLAVNTAVALAAAPETDVAVLDFDFQGGDVATFLAADPACTVADLLRKEGEADSLGAALENTGEGVRVLAAPRTVEEAEEVEGMAAAAGRLLGSARSASRYTLVDLGRHLDDAVLEAAEGADRLFVVCDPLVPAVRAAGRLLETLAKVGTLGERTALLWNRCGGRGRVEPRSAEKALGRKAAARIADGPIEVPTAINRGESVLRAFPRSAVAGDIRSFAGVLADRAVPTGAPGGLLGRLRGLVKRR